MVAQKRDVASLGRAKLQYLNEEHPLNEPDIAPQTPAQALDMAVALHRQGKLREAEMVYRAILKLKPDHFTALHHLG
jgi:hypothetical protein